MNRVLTKVNGDKLLRESIHCCCDAPIAERRCNKVSDGESIDAPLAMHSHYRRLAYKAMRVLIFFWNFLISLESNLHAPIVVLAQKPFPHALAFRIDDEGWLPIDHAPEIVAHGFQAAQQTIRMCWDRDDAVIREHLEGAALV